MHKLHKAVVLLAALGSVGILAAGPAHADGTGQGAGVAGQVSVQQSTTCRSHDLNIDVLGTVGLLDGVLGNGLNGEGDPAAQNTQLGSKMGCDNKAF
jgi:hypothetical protein